jgi:hypothetical protein
MAFKLRARLALIFLVVLSAASLFSGARQAVVLRQQSILVHQNGDDLTHWAERLAPLLPYLPSSGPIGYISEQDIPGLDYSATDQGEEMAMSQYVLAPRILVQGADHPLVIGNIANLSPDQISAVVAPLGLKLEHTFSYGIYLFRRVQK